MKKVFILYFLHISLLTTAQEFLKIDSPKIEKSLNEYCYNITDKECNLTIEKVINGTWKHLPDGPKFGYSMQYEWVKYELKSNLNKPTNFYVYIPYSHINEIDLYVVENGKVVHQKTQGTSQPYDQKDYDSRGYPFKINLKPYTNTQIIMRLDHQYLPLRASAFLLGEHEMIKINNSTESLIWFWRGIFMFAIVISFVLYLSVKQKLFLYYFLFNISFLIFLGTEIGDFFMFFNVDPINYISDIKHVGNYFAIYFVGLFIANLTSLTDLFPKTWKVLYWLGIPLAIMIPIAFLSPFKNNLFYFATDVYMLTWAMVILLGILIMLVPAAIKKKKNALLFLVIYGTYIGALIIDVILPDIGLSAGESANVHKSLLLGSIFEILTFMFLMGREAFGVYKDRASLLEKQKFHQREMLIAIVDSQENERNRVGRELHDMVGANMSIIKQKISETDIQLRDLISSTIESVRTLSHGLVTPRVQSDEFVDEVTEICGLSSNEQLKIYPYFHGWKEIEDTEVTTHLFRIIQELIQNAIKHSQATKAHIQLIREGNFLSIMYEDNGIGFNHQKSRSKGAGLKGIENRVELLNASITFDKAYKNTGTAISIEIKLNQH